MIEKLFAGAAGTLVTALAAYCGWHQVEKLTQAAWAWRNAILAHAAWGTN